ncbi:MAG: acyl-phosphate glycerol 3-phosphate acyltransferase [Candidatus Aquicultor primus]|uniref:Glycerol-3-phosphate acyltransferase n=1 Tax=Candidatus Aquicultor primus TaxID=1797195 RepID=A0A1F2URQ5_9ACTN|nr:MAG: acyl-phosphate glycerol 3-phosphate acyltransferase [Candidatus Aquicultor primus]
MPYLTAALVVFAYLLGSVPFGLVVSKLLFRVDIREHGSGNIGATNAYRTLGPVAGAVVLTGDVLKAMIPVFAVRYFLAGTPDAVPLASVVVGLVAIIGHSYSIFLKFGGGKGMATAGGLMLALWPLVALILLGIWIAVIAVTRYVSLGSIIVAMILPVLVYLMYPKTEYIIFALLAGLLIIFRHRSNIARLLAGEELKIGTKAEAEEG